MVLYCYIFIYDGSCSVINSLSLLFLAYVSCYTTWLENTLYPVLRKRNAVTLPAIPVTFMSSPYLLQNLARYFFSLKLLHQFHQLGLFKKSTAYLNSSGIQHHIVKWKTLHRINHHQEDVLFSKFDFVLRKRSL